MKKGTEFHKLVTDKFGETPTHVEMISCISSFSMFNPSKTDNGTFQIVEYALGPIAVSARTRRGMIKLDEAYADTLNSFRPTLSKYVNGAKDGIRSK